MQFFSRPVEIEFVGHGDGGEAVEHVVRAGHLHGEAAEGLAAAVGVEARLQAAELDAARGANAAYDRFCATLKSRLVDGAAGEPEARRLTQDLALAVQASLLARHAPDFVGDAFCRSRLEGEGGGAFGMLPPGVRGDAIVARAMPAA